MTVRRDKTESFDAAPATVATALRSVFAEKQSDYRYETSGAFHDDALFGATIRPTLWPFVMKTQLIVRVAQTGPPTEVTVETRSQWFVLGDAFSFYDRYIRDVFEGIERQLDALR